MRADHALSQRNRIDRLIRLAKNSDIDDELSSELAKHFTVLISGYLEKAITSILSYFTERKSSPQVSAYAFSQLKRFQNPKKETVLQLIGSFSIDWRKEVDDFLVEEIGDTLESISNNRNAIAHGVSTSVSMLRVEKWWKNSKKIVDKIQDVVNQDLKD